MDPLLDTLLDSMVPSGPLEDHPRLLVQRRWKVSWQSGSIAIADAVDAIADAIVDAIVAATIQGVVQGAQAAGEGAQVIGEGEAAGESVSEGEGGGRGSRCGSRSRDHSVQVARGRVPLSMPVSENIQFAICLICIRI